VERSSRIIPLGNSGVEVLEQAFKHCTAAVDSSVACLELVNRDDETLANVDQPLELL
jgi:hypothetical protein